MNTEPRIRNWVSWTLACAAAALVVTLLAVEYAKGVDFRKAAEWHRIHGNVILVDGHKLSLPQDWWEKYPLAGGKRVVVKASRSLLKTWQTGIIVDRKGASESTLNEDEIRKHLEMFIKVENQGKQAPMSSLVVVRAVSTNIYCRKAMIVEPVVELRCDVAGAPTLITSVGLADTEKEVEGIISTFE